jgi:hypothetical protein
MEEDSIASHIKATFTRVILPKSQAQPLVDRYTKDLNGRVHLISRCPISNRE